MVTPRLKTLEAALATVLVLAGSSPSWAGDAPAVPPAHGPGQAQAVPPGARDTRGVFTFVNENDLYAFKGSDRHYTNGVRIAWLSADDDVPEWAKSFGDALPFLDPGAHRRIGWSLGHNLYTPQDKTRRDLNRDDRPYAAWLYAGLALQSESTTRLDTIEIDVGVVGPAAFGKAVQNNWHDLIGAGLSR